MADDNRSFSDRLKHYWNESLVRHVVFRKGDRKALDLPLLVVIIAAIVAPWLAAGAVVVALIVGYEIRVRREEAVAPPAEPMAGQPTPAGSTAGSAPSATGQPGAPTPPEPPVPPATEPPSGSDVVTGSDVPPGSPEEPPAPQP